MASKSRRGSKYQAAIALKSKSKRLDEEGPPPAKRMLMKNPMFDPESGRYPPPPGYTEDDCPECFGFTNDRRIHPLKSHTQGPEKWLKIDVCKNRHKYPGIPNGQKGYNPEQFRLWVEKQESKLPYTTYSTDADLKPFSSITIQSTDDAGRTKLINATMFRGLPNRTTGGGGYRGYRFGRATVRYHTDPNDFSEECYKFKVEFEQSRDYLAPQKDEKVVGKGHFKGGGTQRKVLPPSRPYPYYTSDDSD